MRCGSNIGEGFREEVEVGLVGWKHIDTGDHFTLVDQIRRCDQIRKGLKSPLPRPK